MVESVEVGLFPFGGESPDTTKPRRVVGVDCREILIHTTVRISIFRVKRFGTVVGKCLMIEVEPLSF